MSTQNPNVASDKDLLLEALRGFVDEYDDDRGTWPEDMVALLDKAHWTLAETTGISRRDYNRVTPQAKATPSRVAERVIPYNPAWTHGEIGADEASLMEANGWRMRPDGSYFKPGS